jgi:hypothetical protein
MSHGRSRCAHTAIDRLALAQLHDTTEKPRRSVLSPLTHAIHLRLHDRLLDLLFQHLTHLIVFFWNRHREKDGIVHSELLLGDLRRR